jgi:hypothetical protein
MSIAANKTTVRRYFEEALDKRNLDVLDEIVTNKFDYTSARSVRTDPRTGTIQARAGKDSPGV